MGKNARTGKVTVRFSSGLGNQLFQLACGMHAAKKMHARLQADTTWFDLVAPLHRPKRTFRLPRLSVELPEAFRGPKRYLVGVAAAAFDRWRCGHRICEELGDLHLVQERLAMTRQEIRATRDSESIYLNGYWQTADHFSAVRDDLAALLSPRTELSLGARDWISQVTSQRSCFLHIRRGDYVALTGDNGLLPREYFANAVRVMQNLGGEWKWVVFCEDAEWARANLDFLADWDLVCYDSDNRDIEDLLIMKACSAAVIANSSFSWWGAALGERADRPVIAPGRYWRDTDLTTRDWRLPAWLHVTPWS